MRARDGSQSKGAPPTFDLRPDHQVSWRGQSQNASRPRTSAAAAAQGGANLRQKGAPATDTADWRDDGGPGNLRVDYVLPDAALTIAGAGVFWPAPEAALAGTVAAGPSHRLVWADVVLPEAAPATSEAKTASAELGR